MYVDSNSPLPPNSLSPAPSPRCAAQRNADVDAANFAAAAGRIAAYQTVPDMGSFASPTVAGDALRTLTRSQAARSSALVGSFPVVDSVQMNTPEVVPLNGNPNACGGIQSPASLPPSPAIVMPAYRTKEVTLSIQNAPTTVFLKSPIPTIFDSPPVTRPSQGMTVAPMQWMGYSGYAPPWGDASVVSVPDPMGVSAGLSPLGIGLLALGGLVLLGAGAHTARKRRKR